MRSILTILFITFTTVLSAQHSQTRQINDYKGISVSSSIIVEYIFSDKNQIVVTCHNKDHLDLLVTEVKNNTLVIGYKSNSNIRTKTPNTVTVYSNSNLEKASVSSSAKLTFATPIKTQSFVLNVNSSGKIVTNTIKADQITIAANSSGKVETNIHSKNLKINASSSSITQVTGESDNVAVNMSSAAKINLDKLIIKDLEVNGSSSATLNFNTAASINSNLSSSARVNYYKLPKNVIANKTSSNGKMSSR